MVDHREQARRGLVSCDQADQQVLPQNDLIFGWTIVRVLDAYKYSLVKPIASFQKVCDRDRYETSVSPSLLEYPTHSAGWLKRYRLPYNGWTIGRLVSSSTLR